MPARIVLFLQTRAPALLDREHRKLEMEPHRSPAGGQRAVVCAGLYLVIRDTQVSQRLSDIILDRVFSFDILFQNKMNA